MSDWRPAAVEALAAAVATDDGVLGALLDEAVQQLAALLAERPPETVAVLAVPVAVSRALTGRPPGPGVLAAAAATYVALRVLDDRTDGDPSWFWADRADAEALVGVQVLLVTAAQVIGEGVPAPVAAGLTRTYRATIARVSDGQLRSGLPLTPSTTPLEVDARIAARSGALLAGFAELAASAGRATPAEVAAARDYGFALGVARQHVNDLRELAGERTSDLRNGTATMATALALQTREPPERERLLARLRAAADDPDRRARLVLELAPAMSEVVALTTVQLARARTHARLLSGTDLRHDDLERLVDVTAADLTGRQETDGQPSTTSR